jgi:uncharacterized protein (DUF58 family)
MTGADCFDQLLPAFLDLPFALPRARELGRVGQRIRVEFGSFREYQPYSPGDDLRALDWKVLARTGERVLRRFDDWEHRSLVLGLDLSASMVSRWDGVSRLLRLYLFLGLHAFDSVELLVTQGDDIRHRLYEGIGAWGRFRTELEEMRPRGKSGLPRLARSLARHAKRRPGILISDWMPDDEALEAFRLLEGSAFVLLFPRIPIEDSSVHAGALTLKTQEGAKLIDPETGAQLEVPDLARALPTFRVLQRDWEVARFQHARRHGLPFFTATLPLALGSNLDRDTHAWLAFLHLGERI